MAQQTAIEYLIQGIKEQYVLTPEVWKTIRPVIEQAKQMEKEQLNIARLEGINLANKGYGKSEDKTFKKKSLWTKVKNKLQ